MVLAGSLLQFCICMDSTSKGLECGLGGCEYKQQNTCLQTQAASRSSSLGGAGPSTAGSCTAEEHSLGSIFRMHEFGSATFSCIERCNDYRQKLMQCKETRERWVEDLEVCSSACTRCEKRRWCTDYVEVVYERREVADVLLVMLKRLQKLVGKHSDMLREAQAISKRHSLKCVQCIRKSECKKMRRILKKYLEAHRKHSKAATEYQEKARRQMEEKVSKLLCKTRKTLCDITEGCLDMLTTYRLSIEGDCEQLERHLKKHKKP